MLLPPTLFIFFLVISDGKCQFVYNYEESDADASIEDHHYPTSYEYNSPSTTNKQFQSRRVQDSNKQDEALNSVPQRSPIRDDTRATETHTQTPYEYIEESETDPRNNPTDRSRRRKYRRISRQGTYASPPQTPRVYSPSVFENIRLGQAPNGVYVPQDSFLNVLNNPSFRQSTANQYNVQNMPSYNQGQAFYVAPPSTNNAGLQAIHPSVRYADLVSGSPSENPNADNKVDVLNSRRTQTDRLRQPDNLPEPMVDIDAMRTHTDATRDQTQARQVNQQGIARVYIRRTVSPRTYQNSIQAPRSYSPSVFQDVRLGEAPNGVHIPSDSLLNVLKSPGSQLPARNAVENTQPSIQLPNRIETTEESYFQPETSHQPVFTAPASRRRSGMRSRSNNVSVQSRQRQTQYQAYDEEPKRIEAPASSQRQRKQQIQITNSSENRRRNTNVPDKRPNSSQQEMSEPSKPSQRTSTRRQQNFKAAKLAVAALPEDTDEDGIPGEAGVNYPTLHTIPPTAFSCADQQHNGYYADVETSCQVFHLCQARGGKSSFLCSNGTIFSQEKFSCQWWYKVNCEESPKFYSINDNLYKTPEKKNSNED